jgi:hypothetical protein
LGKSEELQVAHPKAGPYHSSSVSSASLETPFHPFVSVDKEIALGVLWQDHGGQRHPVAYLSKIIDPVSREWPEYIQLVVV